VFTTTWMASLDSYFGVPRKQVKKMVSTTYNFLVPESGLLAEQMTGTMLPLQTYGYPGEEDRSQPRDSGRDQWPERDQIRSWEPADEWADRRHDPAGNSGAVPGDTRDVWDRL
jgi:hypothetical protein